jgi:hypothetical protein
VLTEHIDMVIPRGGKQARPAPPRSTPPRSGQTAAVRGRAVGARPPKSRAFDGAR